MTRPVQGPDAGRHEWLALQASLDIAQHGWEFRDVTRYLGALRPGEPFTSTELESWVAIADRHDGPGLAMRAALAGAKVDPARLREYAETLARLERKKRAHRLAAFVDDLVATDADELTPETTTRRVREFVDDLPVPPAGSIARADYEAALAELAERAYRTLARRRTDSASSDGAAKGLEELRDGLTAFYEHLQNAARLRQDVSPVERQRILAEEAAVLKRLEALGITVE